MKDFFSKTWVKVISAILICLASILLMGKCSKVNAANFTLSDGTVSDIKYDDASQVLSNGVGANIKTLTIKQTKDGFIFIINTSSALEIYSQCTKTDNTFNCTYWTNIPITSNKTEKTWNSSFMITATSVKKDTWTSYIPQKTYDEGVSDGLASGSANYEQGYIDGQNSVDITSDNQQAIDTYISVNHMKTESEYLSYGESQYKEGQNSVDITSDNQQTIDSYIAFNNMKTESEYLLYGETKYQEGKDSVDITSDNQQVINSYIAANNMKTESEYLLYGETKYQEGKDSVDITSDNQSYANQYIIDNDYKTYTEYLNYGDLEWKKGHGTGTLDMKLVISDAIRNGNFDNIAIDTYDFSSGETVIRKYNITESINWFLTTHNYHTNEEYINYGESQYQEGQNSVDITSDNQQAIDTYITNNQFYSIEEVLKKYNQGQNDVLYRIRDYIYDNYDRTYNTKYECNVDDCSQAVANYANEIYNYGVNEFDINEYINENNYHTNEEYLNYGESKYINGKYDGYNYLMDEISEWLYNMDYQQAYTTLSIYHVDMSDINVNDYADGFDGIHEVNKLTYYETLKNIEDVGYVQAMEDSEAFLGLIPTTLGAVVSNMMPILTYEVYGVSLMNLIGLIAIVGIAIVIVKFIVG